MLNYTADNTDKYLWKYNICIIKYINNAATQ